VRFEQITTNGVRLNVAIDGPEDGPLVILLHGFPEFWFGWRKQIPALAARGFRVVAPDQRGYNDSDKPPRTKDYVLDELAKDAVGLIDAFGRKTASVVGHDWGGAAAWFAALRHPDRVDRLVAIDVPHPLVMRRYLFTRPQQVMKSWYMFFFQLPGLPERLIAQNDFAGFIGKMARPGTFTAAELEVYKEAWRKPGALRSMLAWYRAIPYQITQRFEDVETRVRMPALIIWGKDDAILGEDMAPASAGYCDHGRLVVIEGATHWVHHEEPERVNALIAEHLGR
jgi:pimeloyl-ACP methyl ester carboxylesterase